MDKFKKLSLQAQPDNKGFKAIMNLIIISDLIEWAEVLEDATQKETMLVKLKNKFLRCYKNDLKICQAYNTNNELIYSNVNTPQGNYDWDRVWDNYNNFQRLESEQCANLTTVILGKVVE